MNKNTLKVIIYSGLFLLPVIPFLVSGSFFFPFITTKAFAFRIIVEVVFASWALLALIEPEYRPRKSWLSWAILAFLVIIGLADAFGVVPSKSFWSNFERMEGFVTLLHLGALYLVMSSFFREIDWKRWWNTNLVASFVMIVYAALQLSGALAIHQGSTRVDGTIGNAEYLAVYMLFNIFIALFMLWRERNKGLRWLYGALILLQAWILYSTATRGAILGLIGGLIIMAILGLREKGSKTVRRASIGILAGVIVIIVGFIALRNTAFVKNSPVLSRFGAITTTELRSGGRAFVWPMAIQGIKERPILGWGQDNFNYVFDEHYSAEMFNLEPWFDRAHDIILDWAIAGGILGLLAYLSIYVALIYLVWRKDTALTYLERTIITSLVAAYFFQNLFVFDQLISYIFFFAVLAFVHERSVALVPKPAPREIKISPFAAYPAVIILAALALYFVNVKPIIANAELINALQQTQSQGGDKNKAITEFEAAYNGSRLGRPEVVEQMAANAPTILGDSSVPMQTRNDFFGFVKNAVIDINQTLPNDARYQVLAGVYFVQTGQNDLAKKYLAEAEKLMPEKQAIYFQYGSALLSAGDTQGALAQFKIAYDLAPQYTEAKIIYLAGAILAHNGALEAKLTGEIPHQTYITDDRIVAALLQAGRYSDLESIFKQRIALNPQDGQSYLSLAVVYVRMGDKADAIKTLQDLGSNIPADKSAADQYIQQIQNGTLK